MGNISQKSVQSSDESLKSIEKIFTQTQDSGSLDYTSKLLYIFWRKDVLGNVIIGTIDDKNPYMKFMYKLEDKQENPQQNIYEREKNWNEFKESLIQVQDAEQITYDITLNDFIKEYQQCNNPQYLIELILHKQDIIIEKDPKNLDQNSNKGKLSTSYSFCFQNYINKNQVIFVKSGERDNISFDWKENQALNDSKKFIYKDRIQLKTPLKDSEEIRKKCSSYKSAKQFLKDEKS